MRNKKFFYGLCLVCFLVSACVSKEKYSELEATLADTQAKLEQNSNQVEELELKLKQSEANWNQCQQDIGELQGRYEDLQRTHQQVAHTLEELRLEFNKKDIIIQQKEDIIKDLDEARRRIETHLKDVEAQIEIQEQKITEQKKIIANLDDTRRRVENSLKDRKSDIGVREEKIRKLENAIAHLDETKRQIETSLKKQLESQQVKLEEMEGKLRLTFVDKILFNSGSVGINKRGKDLLLRLAESLKQNRNQNIMVQGHTDNIPIVSELREKYPTNWELSAARSAVVVRYLQEKGNVEPERFTACGYSFYRPVASNETKEGQHQNRRIEIILAPRR
jgi:chemotaxis protein MotB